MNADRRRKLQALERELGRLDGVEKRVLADLRLAGYQFRTVAQARQWMAAECTLQRRTADQLVETYLENQELRKTKSNRRTAA